MSDGAWDLDRNYPAEGGSDELAVDEQNLKVVLGIGSLTGSDLRPAEEGIDPGESTESYDLPPTTLDVRVVKHLLDKHNSTTPDIRAARLLAYAWNAGSIVQRNVAEHIYLLGYITDNPVDWYNNNQDLIEEILAGKRSRGNAEKHPRLLDYVDLIEMTRHFDATPFLRNAMRIKRESWGSYEGVRVEAAARLIMHEAEQAYLDGMLQ